MKTRRKLVYELVNSEVDQRIEKDSEILSLVEEETKIRQSEDTEIKDSIETAVTDLSSSIERLSTGLQAQITEIDDSLSAEIERSSTEDESLKSRVSEVEKGIYIYQSEDLSSIERDYTSSTRTLTISGLNPLGVAYELRLSEIYYDDFGYGTAEDSITFFVIAVTEQQMTLTATLRVSGRYDYTEGAYTQGTLKLNLSTDSDTGSKILKITYPDSTGIELPRNVYISSIRTLLKASDLSGSPDLIELQTRLEEEKELRAIADTELQSSIDTEKQRLDTFLLDSDLSDAAIDTLKEIQEYITSDGEAAATIVSNVSELRTNLEELSARLDDETAERETKDSELETSIQSQSPEITSITTTTASGLGSSYTYTDSYGSIPSIVGSYYLIRYKIVIDTTNVTQEHQTSLNSTKFEWTWNSEMVASGTTIIGPEPEGSVNLITPKTQTVFGTKFIKSNFDKLYLMPRLNGFSYDSNIKYTITYEYYKIK